MVGVVSNVFIGLNGSGYTSTPTVSFVGGGGSGAAGIVTILNGAVVGVNITNPGTGYSSAFAVILFVTIFGLANIYVKALNRVKQR